MNFYVIKQGNTYWSNRTGFGSFETATVFTQAERDYYTLPYPQPECSWELLDSKKHRKLIEKSLEQGF